MLESDIYKGFQKKADKIKYDLVDFLVNGKKKGIQIVAYGAAAKGNTLLNYAGIKKDCINYVVDKSPYKQGKYMPGSHIPIVDEKQISMTKPDYILILPWNIKEEIIKQLSYVREWGCKFIVAIPQLEVI